MVVEGGGWRYCPNPIVGCMKVLGNVYVFIRVMSLAYLLFWDTPNPLIIIPGVRAIKAPGVRLKRGGYALLEGPTHDDLVGESAGRPKKAH